MKKTIVLATLALGLGAVLMHVSAGHAAAQTSTLAANGHQIGISVLPGNLQMREPILVFDVSGSSLLGPLHSRLSVYNDGLATVSRWSDNVVFGGEDGDAAINYVGSEAVDSLRKQLSAAGAFSLTDQLLIVADLPLSTVTFFRKPGTRSVANTYSYWVGTGEYGAVNTVIANFIDAHFPGF